MSVTVRRIRIMSEQKITSINDTPHTEQDFDLGTKNYVDGLAKFIKNSATPLTVALQGEWGSGKTSLMSKLERELCGNDKLFVGVTINTWEYSMLSSPEITVLRILDHLVRQLSKYNPDIQKKLVKALEIIAGIGVRFGREAFKIATGEVGAKFVEAVGVRNGISESDTNITFTLSEMRDDLNKAIESLLKKDTAKKGVIIFVDDLDRLNPPLAVEILELLKNIFTIDHCIFVLAIDYDVVVKGLEPKFGKLTATNEREFRSFFDKIIQVPFSLPVSSYKPMTFVSKSLKDIGYMDGSDARLEEVIVNSVGKNPRSIKRLINTLSLLSCIENTDINNDYLESADGKIANLAVVAIQVCYPKVYRMLTIEHDFRKWDSIVALRLNVGLRPDTDGWEDVLKQVCDTDSYLKQRYADIVRLMDILKSALEKDDQNHKQFKSRIDSIIDKSSVTSVAESSRATETDVSELLKKIQPLVAERIKKECPEIPEVHTRPITAKGGLFVYYTEKKRFGVRFIPVVKENRIAFAIELETRVPRPERLKDARWDEIFAENGFAIIDETLRPLLGSDNHYFEGRTHGTRMFPSFTEEQEYLAGKGWIPEGTLSENVTYWINLPNAAAFENPKVIGDIAAVVVATYRFYKALRQRKQA